MTKVQQLREAKGMTYWTLTRRAKISCYHLAAIEGGKFEPTIGTLKKLAKALECPLNELMREYAEKAATPVSAQNTKEFYEFMRKHRSNRY
ncbi:MAG: helix-turn-helix domain-containing protein [Firmicutes bacterium]|nr:helix-turn-helix domain-containing protein [Bacillota bacterium]